jgi:hypothetical protein
MMFQFYYLFLQHITYIALPSAMFGKTWEKWGIPRTTDVGGAVFNALLLAVFYIHRFHDLYRPASLVLKLVIMFPVGLFHFVNSSICPSPYPNLQFGQQSSIYEDILTPR